MALPSLDTKTIRKIEGLIQGWTTKLTWDLLVQRIETDFGVKTTRQTLNSYTSIKTMYSDKKQQLRGAPSEQLIKFVKSDTEAVIRIQKLESEIASLIRQNEKQRAFISEVAMLAKSNPSVLDLIERVKNRVARS